MIVGKSFYGGCSESGKAELFATHATGAQANDEGGDGTEGCVMGREGTLYSEVGRRCTGVGI
jgi:hypothetical protein